MKKDKRFEELIDKEHSLDILSKIKEFKKIINKYSYRNDFLHFEEKKELSKELLTLIMLLKMIESEVNAELKNKERSLKNGNYYI